MKTITSRENPTYKDASKLLRRKYREETGRYLLEGIKPVKDAIIRGIGIEKIFIREGSGNAAGLEGEVICLAGELFDEISDTGTSQGVIALVKRTNPDEESFIDRAGKGNILLLDRLQDPGNVGTVIRTAEAAGITGIIALKGTADIYSPKVVRAAAGSLFRMPVLEGLREDEALDIIATGGWKLAVSTVDGGQDCFDPLPEGRICLAVGNEGAGVAGSIIQKADIRLMIPMEGEIESLNAAVAAGILMYRIRKEY